MPQAPLTTEDTLRLAAELAALEAEHTPQEVPPCKVCGEPLILCCDGQDERVYYCSSKNAEPSIDINAKERIRHIAASEWIDCERTDPRILRLIAEVRARRGELP